MNILTIILICAVTVMGIIDYKRKSVSAAALLGLLIFSALWNIISGDKSMAAMLIGLLPAAFMLLAVKIGRLKIGMGDIFLIAVLGIALGADTVCMTLLVASVLCAGVGAVLLAVKRVRRDQTLAFIPFIGAGLVVSEILKGTAYV